jgi:hypothetical protein
MIPEHEFEKLFELPAFTRLPLEPCPLLKIPGQMPRRKQMGRD